MSFKDCLERYRNGTATPEEIKIVEEELEKFEALNDLAYENISGQIDGFIADPLSDDKDDEAGKNGNDAKGGADNPDNCGADEGTPDGSEKADPAAGRTGGGRAIHRNSQTAEPRKPQERTNCGGSQTTKTRKPQRHANHRKEISDSERFTRQINREIKKTFVKIGLCSGACVMVIVLFLIFGLSPLMNVFFYDPTEPVWEADDNDYAPERLSVDLGVYTELLMPLNKYDSTISLKQGFGKYYFTANKVAWINDAENGNRTIAGEISRGNLQIFTPDVLERPADNVMGLTDDANKDSVMYGTSPEDALAEIKSQSGGRKLIKAYVTFNKDLSFADACRILEDYDTFSSWLGVRLPDDRMGYGFTIDTSGAVFEKCKINKNYPALLFNGVGALADDFESKKTEKYFRNHFVSMLKYLSDNRDFVDMIDKTNDFNSIDADSISKYLKKNGLQIYGVATYADRDTLIDMYSDPAVYGILINAE